MGKPLPVYYTLGPEIFQFGSQNSCPLRESSLDLGSASAVTTGSAVSTVGWSSERAEKTGACPYCAHAMRARTPCAFLRTKQPTYAVALTVFR